MTGRVLPGRPCIVLDMTDVGSWPAAHRASSTSAARMPPERQATVLHFERNAADRERARLAAANPSRVFVVLECPDDYVVALVPDVVKADGTVTRYRQMLTRVTVDDDNDDAPF